MGRERKREREREGAVTQTDRQKRARGIYAGRQTNRLRRGVCVNVKVQ